MRRQRARRNAARAAKPASVDPREIELPGLEALQEREEREAAWYEDPSYADREIDRSAFAELEAYRKEGLCP